MSMTEYDQSVVQGPAPSDRQAAYGLPSQRGEKLPGQVRDRLGVFGYGTIGAMMVPPMSRRDCKRAMKGVGLEMKAGEHENNFRRAVKFLTGLSIPLIRQHTIHPVDGKVKP